MFTNELLGFRHAHYLFSNSVGLLLVRITWLIDGKLRLYHAGTKEPLGREISRGLTRNIKEASRILSRWLSIMDPVVRFSYFIGRFNGTVHVLSVYYKRQFLNNNSYGLTMPQRRGCPLSAKTKMSTFHFR